MKKLTLILLALCLAISLFAAVACTPDSTDTDDNQVTVDGPDVTDGPDEGGDDVTPDTEYDSEDDAFISVSPSDDEQEWGDINLVP